MKSRSIFRLNGMLFNFEMLDLLNLEVNDIIEMNPEIVSNTQSQD